MLIPDLFLKHGIRPRGIIHIGAHMCEESSIYTKAGVPDDRVVWVEANPAVAESARRAFPSFRIIQACVSDKEGVVTFKETNNGESSSILDLGTHRQEHPGVFVTRTYVLPAVPFTKVAMDEGLDMASYDFLNMDIQGAELLALKGMEIGHFEHMYLEVNVRELYTGCALLPELAGYLAEHGFQLVDICMTRHGWGDALFSKKHS